jgi:hypothetical protein
MTQRAKIEPLIRRTLHRSVVEIESVDINVGFGHCIQSLTDSIRWSKNVVDFRLTESYRP